MHSGTDARQAGTDDQQIIMLHLHKCENENENDHPKVSHLIN